MTAAAQQKKPEPSIQDRIQQEVQRAIQRSVKGVEYFASAAPVVGTTAKDVLHSRGTMKLYHYRPLADEIYRVPILIVMATTNRGYILDAGILLHMAHAVRDEVEDVVLHAQRFLFRLRCGPVHHVDVVAALEQEFDEALA